MDWDAVVKIVEIIGPLVVAIAGIFGLPKIIHENSALRKTQRREEYEFSKKFISEVFEDETCKKVKVHPLIVEKGYQAISGEQLNYESIMVLLKFPNPSLALKALYRSGDFIELTSDGYFRYIKKYNSHVRRFIYNKLYYIQYFVISMLAILLYVYREKVGLSFVSIQSIIQFIIYEGVLLFWAVSQLVKAINMEFANHIIEEQANINKVSFSTESTTQPAISTPE